MNEPHIATAFDRDLESLQATIIKMGGLVEDAILNGAEALLTRDTEKAEQVHKGDAAVDALEDVVNDEAVRLMALRQPVSTDLRLVVSTLKLAQSLERVGDYAKNIAKRTSVLAEMKPISGGDATLRRMAREVQGMLKDTLDSFVRRDTALARDVVGRDQDVDQMYNALFRELLTHMMEDPRNITPAMHLHFIAKNIERVGDHATAVAEQVIYLVTGQMPGDARPKVDSTLAGPGA